MSEREDKAPVIEVKMRDGTHEILQPATMMCRKPGQRFGFIECVWIGGKWVQKPIVYRSPNP